MMILFVILVYFNDLFVSSEGNYLPFLYSANYSILNGQLDYAINVSLPSLIRFGSLCYTDAWISTNGLISLGTSFTNYRPNLFPITTPVIAPYWDDSDLSVRGEVRYAIVTPTTNISLCNQVNDYLSTSTGSSVSVEWVLWAYWYDVCPFTNNCNNIQSNHFQVVLAFQSSAAYTVFIYKCGLIRWTRYRAGVGINSGDGYYINHPLSNTDNVIDIDCYDETSGWSNVVYRVNQAIDKFEFLSITSHSITVSWELGIPVINSTVILSVTDGHQTVNDEIDVTGYDSYTYSYSKDGYLCNVYAFKLTLPATKKGCNNDSKILFKEVSNKSQNVLIIGICFGFSAFANLILLLTVVVLLINKCRKRSQSSAPHDPKKNVPVKTEVNSAYEMMQRRSNQIQTSNQIQISQNCSYAGATNVDDAHISPIYDDISQEIPPEPDTPHIYDDESAAPYEIPSSDVN